MLMFENFILDVHIKASHMLASSRRKGEEQRSGPQIYPRCNIRLLYALNVPITDENGQLLRYKRYKRGQEFEAEISQSHAKILLTIDNSQIEHTIPLLNVELA